MPLANFLLYAICRRMCDRLAAAAFLAARCSRARSTRTGKSACASKGQRRTTSQGACRGRWTLLASSAHERAHHDETSVGEAAAADGGDAGLSAALGGMRVAEPRKSGGGSLLHVASEGVASTWRSHGATDTKSSRRPSAHRLAARPDAGRASSVGAGALRHGLRHGNAAKNAFPREGRQGIRARRVRHEGGNRAGAVCV